METTIRRFIKAISWHTIVVFAVFIISWILTRNATLAATIAVVEIVTRLFLYWLHEWFWSRTSWGINRARLTRF